VGKKWEKCTKFEAGPRDKPRLTDQHPGGYEKTLVVSHEMELRPSFHTPQAAGSLLNGLRLLGPILRLLPV